jgi:cell division protein FtsB
MKRSGVIVMSVLMVAMGASAVRGESDYGYLPGWYPGYSELGGTIGEVLAAINNPAHRSDLAQQWLAFSRQAISKSLEQRSEWLKIQAQQVQAQQHADQSNVEAYKLQLQIEQLRAENLKLERENLELRQQLQAHATPPPQTQPQS